MFMTIYVCILLDSEVSSVHGVQLGMVLIHILLIGKYTYKHLFKYVHNT